jgi:hypothetical protein
MPTMTRAAAEGRGSLRLRPMGLGCQAWSVEFREQARQLAHMQTVDDRELRDAADAHIKVEHPGLADRLTESYNLDLDDQIDELLDLIQEAGSGEDFLGYIKFLGPDN